MSFIFGKKKKTEPSPGPPPDATSTSRLSLSMPRIKTVSASPSATPSAGEHPLAGSYVNPTSPPRQHRDPSAPLSQAPLPTTAPTRAGSRTLRPPEAGLKAITMEFGDTYAGETTPHKTVKNVAVPHGHGTLQSPYGRHCYIGDFNYQQREGDGKLVTDRYALWAKWKSNRPATASSVRVDLPSGDKFIGNVELVAMTTNAAALASSQVGSSPITSLSSISKFSQWVYLTALHKSGWGELAGHDGRRYFGQWAHDQSNGFGCLLTPTGERYIGTWARGQFHGRGVFFARTGLIYDGEWSNGVFQSRGGGVYFESQLRLVADWEDTTRFKNATVEFPDRHERDRRWVSTSQFDKLLEILTATDTQRRALATSAVPLRQELLEAETAEQVDHVVAAFLRSNEAFSNALKFFRRSFYFFFGTCGHSQRCGGGQKGNDLGWCYLRRYFGGCIHRSNGVPFTETHCKHAIGDIISFAGSVVRWVLEKVGGEAVANHVADLEAVVLLHRRVVDSILPLVHAPLMNVYAQVYKAEQDTLDAALVDLRDVSMDDVGVSFGRQRGQTEALFTPYADAMRSLKLLSTAGSMTSKLAALRRWSAEIDQETRSNQIKLHDDDALRRLSLAVRAPAATSSTTTQPATQPVPVSGGASMGTATAGPSEAGSLPVVTDEHATPNIVSPQRSPPPGSPSDPGPLSPRAFPATPGRRPASDPPTPQPGVVGADSSRSTSPLPELDDVAFDEEEGEGRMQQAFRVVAGSADDLFPIHQYTFLKSEVPRVVALAKLLGDLGAVDLLLDPTSQESFCLTTLQACTAVAGEMHLGLRDENGVIVPISALQNRVDDIMGANDEAALAAAAKVGKRYCVAFLDDLPHLHPLSLAAASTDSTEDASIPRAIIQTLFAPRSVSLVALAAKVPPTLDAVIAATYAPPPPSPKAAPFLVDVVALPAASFMASGNGVEAAVLTRNWQQLLDDHKLSIGSSGSVTGLFLGFSLRELGVGTEENDAAAATKHALLDAIGSLLRVARIRAFAVPASPVGAGNDGAALPGVPLEAVLEAAARDRKRRAMALQPSASSASLQTSMSTPRSGRDGATIDLPADRGSLAFTVCVPCADVVQQTAEGAAALLQTQHTVDCLLATCV